MLELQLLSAEVDEGSMSGPLGFTFLTADIPSLTAIPAMSAIAEGPLAVSACVCVGGYGQLLEGLPRMSAQLSAGAMVLLLYSLFCLACPRKQAVNSLSAGQSPSFNTALQFVLDGKTPSLADLQASEGAVQLVPRPGALSMLAW